MVVYVSIFNFHFISNIYIIHAPWVFIPIGRGHMSAVYNFTVPQFATFETTITIRDELNIVRDLSNYIAKMQVRYKHKGGSLIFTLSMDDGLVINTETNVITLTISAERTGLLKDDAFYDLIIINGDTVERILEGQLIVSEGVTR